MIAAKELDKAMPVRVAQILNRMNSGGIESVVMNYYRHMDREQIQFDFYFAADSTFPQREELNRLGAGIFPVPPYDHPLAYHRALYHAFKENEYAIVHAHLSTMSVFALFAAWRAGVPVRICHNHTTAHWGEGKKSLLKYILRPFNKLFATDYFSCGEKAGRWMYGARSFNAGRVHVMPNAIDAEKFAYDPEARIRLRDELHIPQNAFVVGHVGRFTYQKNHPFLLQVFGETLRLRPDARLLLLGEGETWGEVRAQAGRMNLAGRMFFTGARRDVAKMYSAMDVFCLPSFYEGLPVVALEAQANGLPCLFSDQITGEVFLNHNTAALPLEDPLHWARVLLRAEREPQTSPIPRFDVRMQAEWLASQYLAYARRLPGHARKKVQA